MKTMTCEQLGGACEETFQAETFEEMAELSKQHGMKMFAVKDAAHLGAMQRIQSLMQDPAAMKDWTTGNGESSTLWRRTERTRSTRDPGERRILQGS